ncbi:MAG: aminotransferase class I/II-fold pyridoxal phosphate-dependent enzyme [Peptoniphilus sp.]|nr:aminotransferase class I/II-fold pyridoxal phosphate-dependent enzyme [Peptoniphilus sp.]MDD7362866.1 aminotransferase class I/II-fold pyridoxal phosphate-dependent enzyme [Bacillota bacterium]MDY6044893.1 aminotransferase class I/II-fold pyridoxal phosphate-dependent enzyme [Peptoniphilus sp.]
MKSLISKKYRAVQAGGLAESADLAKSRGDIVDFTLGDPDITTPRAIIEAAFRDALDGHTHYTESGGDAELIDAIIDFQRDTYGIAWEAGNVFVTTSACHGMWLVLETMLDPGDEVLIIEPYFSPYADQVEMAGGVPVFVETDPDRGFVPRIEDIREKVSEKTKAMIVNTPNNPSGLCLDEETLRRLAALAEEEDFFIVADDIYTAFSYDAPFVPMASFEAYRDRVITLRSFSKNFAMTGWRIGYILGDENFIRAAKTVNEQNVYSAPSISQRAALYALRHRDEVQPPLIEAFRTRTFHAYERLSRLKNIRVSEPRGTFYIFVDVRPTGKSEEDVWKMLMEEAGVLTVKGSAFGRSGEGFLRFAVTVDEEAIDRAFDRIEKMEIFQ